MFSIPFLVLIVNTRNCDLNCIFFFFLTDKNNKVKLKDLLGSLPNKGVQVSLRKQINKLRGRQAVRVPAPKHEREKVIFQFFTGLFLKML